MEEGRDHFESENSEKEENMDVEIEEPIDAQNQENDDSEEDIEEGELVLNNIHFKYNEEEFKMENILQFLIQNNIIKNNPICEICDHPMKLVKIKKRIDGKIWRCKKKV